VKNAVNIAWKYAFEASRPHFDSDIYGAHQHNARTLVEHYRHTYDLYTRCDALQPRQSVLTR
jgi:hypothetical protein